MKLVKSENEKNLENKISDEEVEQAFVKIIKYIGEDPTREGLLSTPKRLVKAFKEYFKGYNEDPEKILAKTFGDVEGYDDMVIQKNISLQKCPNGMFGCVRYFAQPVHRRLPDRGAHVVSTSAMQLYFGPTALWARSQFSSSISAASAS